MNGDPDPCSCVSIYSLQSASWLKIYTPKDFLDLGIKPIGISSSNYHECWCYFSPEATLEEYGIDWVCDTYDNWECITYLEHSLAYNSASSDATSSVYEI